MTFAARLLHRMDLGDRHLLGRWAIGDEASRIVRRFWIGVTHAGGAVVTIGSVLVPVMFQWWPRTLSIRAGMALTISHLMVQLVKRRICRERPSATPIVRCPDQFSFPSGHATAALAVAASYAISFPGVAVALVTFALLVGWSRVVLGVHYPGDVAVGQMIALATVGGLAAMR